MRQPTAFILTVLLPVVLFYACKKEDVAPVAEPVKKEFEPCACATVPAKEGQEEYIKAEIDGIPVCFDVMPQLSDTFPNMLKWGYILRDTGNQYYDNVHMIRNAGSGKWQAALFFENTHLLTKTFPYELPRANPEYCEIGGLQINDLNHYVGCTFCPENDFNYYASFWGNGVKMKAFSFSNNVFEGSFEGTVRTGSGKSVPVKNGRFRIKLIVYRDDFQVK